MTATSRVVAGAVVCAAVSFSGVAGGPAQAYDGSGGATPTAGRAIGSAGGALGGAVENLGRSAGGAVGGAVGGTGGAVGGAVGGPAAHSAGGSVGGTVRGVTRAVGGTVRGATTTVGGTVDGTVDHVANSTGRRLPQQPSSSPLTSGPTTSGGTSPSATGPQPRTAAVTPVKDRAPATANRKPARKEERAKQVRVSPAAAAAAHALILAYMRSDLLHRSAMAGSAESAEVMPASSNDESCLSASLAIADLRRCAHASMLIPQLGGPASVWMPLSLAMVGTGLVLVARRRRDAALETPAG
ncbi:hypothetical protein [Nocardioides sp. CER19]|uniref:hypothetical protein n=1 Tax=Nocardioides sp. CER19 TaxID=3038538 RepID=UPI00244B738D|nr:hypothetical protein [Nocardioides sp. CER19]MDH2414448.1 hypothetical protein [Nocardioides sp. CER19]